MREPVASNSREVALHDMSTSMQSPESGFLIDEDESVDEGYVSDSSSNTKRCMLTCAAALTLMALVAVGAVVTVQSLHHPSAGTPALTGRGSDGQISAERGLEFMSNPTLQQQSSRTHNTYDILHTGPGLKWFPKTLKTKKGWTLYAGNLTVPLSPYPEDKEDTPHVDLLVMMAVRSDKDASKLEPLLHHCGGPGSGADCVLGGMRDEFADYAGLSISQRGIGTLAQPSFECSPDSLKMPPKGLVGQYKISHFTNCECALPDGTPLVGQSFVDIDPHEEGQVHLLFENLNKRSLRCSKMKKWTLKGPRGKAFNFLEWSGTAMLAFDIEYLRTQIGAQTMSIDGGSYGTAVGAVYANKFPERVSKLVLNGCMPPVPETKTFAEGNGWALTQAFAHLEYNCAAWSETFPCNLTNSMDQIQNLWEKLIAEMRQGALTAPTKVIDALGATVMFKLQIGLVGAYLQEQMIAAGFAPIGWTAPVLTIANLAGQRGAKEKENQVKTILDRFCRLPSHPSKSWSGVTTWDNYNVCIGEQSVALSSRRHTDPLLTTIGFPPESAGSGGFVNEAAVLGQDYFDRFTVSQAMGIWRQYSSTWGVMATGAFVAIFSEVFAWRPAPTPIQAGYRGGVKALILGNLYDPATRYAWSNEMRESLPASVMMTWQGVGHMTTQGGDYNNSGMQPCLDRVKTYWKTGELPIDGFTCRANAPLPL